MLLYCLYSSNKRAKNWRDKEREYRACRYDEYDNEESEYEKIDENTYILSGSMPVYDVNKLLNAKIPEGDYDTLSGFLQDELDRIPEEEENPIIETEEITYKIEEYEDKRILKVKACKNNHNQNEEEK